MIISFIGGRNAEELQPLVRHLVKHISEPRYTKQLTGIAHRLLDLYGTAVSLGLGVQHAGLQNSIVCVSLYLFTIFMCRVTREVYHSKWTEKSFAAVEKLQISQIGSSIETDSEIRTIERTKLNSVFECVQVGETPELDLLLRQLQHRVNIELRTQDALARLAGMLEPILATAAVSGLILA